MLQTPDVTLSAAGVAARRIHVAAVTGAPGDANRFVRQAMIDALRRAGLVIAGKAERARAVIAGTVGLGAVKAGHRVVSVRWVVRGRDGAELGALTQRNSVPQALLRGSWRALAVGITNAAAGGVVEVLERRSNGRLQNARGG
jgi:hypothetical protein